MRSETGTGTGTASTGAGFLGRGWAFPVALDPDLPSLAAAEGEEKIRQAVAILLATRRGERIMRPDFGCGLHELVWETPTPALLSAAADAVRAALLRFEPRIDVARVDVRLDPGDPAVLQVELRYTVRTTNTTFNHVYPFSLEP